MFLHFPHFYDVTSGCYGFSGNAEPSNSTPSWLCRISSCDGEIMTACYTVQVLLPISA